MKKKINQLYWYDSQETSRRQRATGRRRVDGNVVLVVKDHIRLERTETLHASLFFIDTYKWKNLWRSDRSDDFCSDSCSAHFWADESKFLSNRMSVSEKSRGAINISIWVLISIKIERYWFLFLKSFPGGKCLSALSIWNVPFLYNEGMEIWTGCFF